MTDTIQSRSTLPLPLHQTEAGQRDPLPATSSRLQEELGQTEAEARGDVQRDDFKTYLDQQSITTLKLVQAETFFDPARDIQKNSAYQGLGDTKTL